MAGGDHVGLCSSKFLKVKKSYARVHSHIFQHINVYITHTTHIPAYVYLDLSNPHVLLFPLLINSG